MTATMVLALVGAILFGGGAGMFGVYARRASSRQIPLGAPSPLIGRGLRKDPARWTAVHSNAVPYLWTAAIIALVQAIACLSAVLYPGLMSPGYIITLLVVGVALIVGLMVLAGRG